MAFDPFVGLFGRDRADEPDQGAAVGEDTHDVGAAADLAIQAFLRVIGPELTPDLLREAGEREHVRPNSLELVAPAQPPKARRAAGDH